jgi:hypothetical protein
MASAIERPITPLPSLPEEGILRDGDDAAHALDRVLRRPLLGIGVDRSEERDGAFVYGDANLRRVDLRVPAQLRFDVTFQLQVGLFHQWLRVR